MEVRLGVVRVVGELGRERRTESGIRNGWKDIGEVPICRIDGKTSERVDGNGFVGLALQLSAVAGQGRVLKLTHIVLRETARTGFRGVAEPKALGNRKCRGR